MPVSGVGVAGAGGGGTLQDSYASGESIEVTTANGSFTIVNSADATDTLVVNRTFAGGGSGIDVNMGTGGEAVTGSGLTIDMGSTSTGAAFSATLVAGAAGDGVQINDAGDGTSIFANKTSSSGAAIDIQSSGTSVLTVSAIGDFTAASTVGSSEVYEVRLDAAGGAVMRSSIDGTATGSDITIESDAIAAGATASDIIISTITSGGGTAGGVVINAGGVSAPTPSTGAAIVQGGIIVEISAEPASGPNKLTLAAAGVILKGEANVAGPKAADVTVASTQSGAGAGDAGNIQFSSEVTNAGSGDAGDVTVKSEVTGTGTAGIVNILSDANINGTEGGISLEVHSGGAALAIPATGQILLTTGSEVQIDAFNLDINTPFAAVSVEATQVLMEDGTATLPAYSFTSSAAGMFMIGASLAFATGGDEKIRIGANQLGLDFTGSAAIPALTFGIGATRGFFANVANEIGISTNGVERMSWTANDISFANPLLGANGTGGSPTYAFSNGSNTGMWFGPVEAQLNFSTSGQTAYAMLQGLNNATGDEAAHMFYVEVNKLTSGKYYGIQLDVDEDTTNGIGEAGNLLMRLRAQPAAGSMTQYFAVSDRGAVHAGPTPGSRPGAPDLSFGGAENMGFYPVTVSQMIWAVTGAARLSFSSTVFGPSVNNSLGLGTSASKFKDVYAYTLQMDDGVVGAPSHSFDAHPQSGMWYDSTQVVINGDTSQSFGFGATLNRSYLNLEPRFDGTLDLGGASFRWNNFYTEAMNLADATAAVDDTIAWDTFGITYGGSDSDFSIKGAAAAVDAAGKDMSITGAAGGVASASAGGIGADVTVRSGFGGAGTAGLTAGAGGDLNLVGRDAGADNGGGGANGGNVVITAGLATGAGAAGQVLFGRDGAASLPSMSWSAEPLTGIYLKGVGAAGMGFSVNSVERIQLTSGVLAPIAAGGMNLGSSGLPFGDVYAQVFLAEVGAVGAPSVTFDGFTDVGLFHVAANQLGLAANSEAVIVDNDSATPSFRPDVDDTWTLGESAFKWADGFFTQTTVGDINLRGVHDDAHWTINEDRSGLYVHDRKTGKKYKLLMEEVDEAPEPLPKKEAA